MDLSCIQEAMRKSYYERDLERGLHATFTWFVEEIGELAEALLKRDERMIREEVADVLAWLLSIANLLDLDVENAMIEKYGRDLHEAGCLRD
jgi:NTP pyrophosphatase (non-canonical NTP hydrolase)